MKKLIFNTFYTFFETSSLVAWPTRTIFIQHFPIANRLKYFAKVFYPICICNSITHPEKRKNTRKSLKMEKRRNVEYE